MKQRQYCNKFNKDFKNSPHQKNLKKVKILVVTIGKDGHSAHSKREGEKFYHHLLFYAFEFFVLYSIITNMLFQVNFAITVNFLTNSS